MPLINADSIIQNPFQPSQWLPASEFMAYFGGAPAVNGQFNVDAMTRVLMPDGQSTATAGEIEAAGILGKKEEKKPARAENDTSAAATAASVKNILSQYGLSELEPLVDGWIRAGMSWDEIEVQLRDPSTKAGKVLDRIYPEIRMAREAGAKMPLSIADIQNYRKTTKQLVNMLGFGDAIPDTDALARDYIVNDKSPDELKARLVDIGDYAEAVLTSNPVSRSKLDELQAYYGVAPSRRDLIAFALNDNFTEATLHKRLEAAAAGAAARTSGFGGIDRTQAEMLGTLGVTEEQARQGFGQLAGLKGATGELAGQSVDVIGQQDQIDAAFTGNEFARRRIARRQREQQGVFQGGGGFAQTREGFGGTGTAR